MARTIDLPLPKAEEPCVSARLRPGRPDQSDFQQIAEEPCRSARLRPARPDQSEFLRKADEAGSGLPEVGLYSDIGMGQPIQGPSCLEWQEAEARLPGTARVQLCYTAVFDQSRLWLCIVAEQEPEDAEIGRLLGLIRIQTSLGG